MSTSVLRWLPEICAFKAQKMEVVGGLGLDCKMDASTPYFLDLPDISSFRPQS
jgi:hypothetical protein